VSAGERAVQTGFVVDITRHYLGTERRERARFVRFHVPRDSAGRETAARVVQNSADESATLSASGAYNCDDFFRGHRVWEYYL